MDRGSSAGWSLSVLALGLVLVACAGAPAGPAPGGSADPARAADQARTFHTIATQDFYANYGEQFTRFCQVTFGFDCTREGRDLGGMSSAQEVQQWVAEKNNPQSVLADIGILFIPQAEQVGILADYEAPNAGLLPDDLHGPGWVATFVGVPSMIVNLDVLEARGLEVPRTWDDLTDPSYRGMVGLGTIGVSGSATWSFVAMNLAAGGTLDHWRPGIEYGRRLLPNITQQATVDTFARGEAPISVRYDFNQIVWFEELDAKGVRYEMIVPSDGSVYSPSTLMMNRYDVAHHDFAKMFMEWVLTDEAQVIFAKYGSRPIRWATGEDRIDVPAEARANWLPDEAYANVETVEWRDIDAARLQQMWEDEVESGG